MHNDLSCRGKQNVKMIMPKIRDMVSEQMKTITTAIDLSTAENWLLRPELVSFCQKAVTENLQAEDLSYPRGFAGDPALLDALAGFFNLYFEPRVPIESCQIATAPGASSCLDALLYNICDPGDGVLVPGPYWYGFDFFLQTRSSVVPILARLPNLYSAFTEETITALQKALENAPCKVRAVLLTNPHNPLGQRYPRTVLESCLKFCQEHDLHFISDEVYALTSFDCPDISDPAPFVSALALDVEGIGCDLSMIHTVWSPSKDFGQSGFRLGCIISQANQELVNGLALASTRQVSSLTNIVVRELLRSDSLVSLIQMNKQRLRKNYDILRAFMLSRQIRYIPCYAGLSVFAQFAQDSQAPDAEDVVIKQLREAGVLVSAGSGYYPPESERGWVRIGFAVETALLQEAISRMKTVLEKHDSSDKAKSRVDTGESDITALEAAH